MARTVNRIPASVNISSRDTNKYFNQTQFAGINNNLNEVNINQKSFADANNVYVSTSEQLCGRPALNLPDLSLPSLEYTFDDWWFDDVHITLVRYISEIFDEEGTPSYSYTYLLADEQIGITPNYIIQLTEKSSIRCMPVLVDNIVFFFTDIGHLYCYNLGTKSFEDMQKYVYVPITKQSINDILSDLESPNVLTDAYRIRHQYSALSNIDFYALMNKNLQVSVMTNDTENYLYDIKGGEDLQYNLLYPKFIKSSYEYRIVKTNRSYIYLRYNLHNNEIAISFNGYIYNTLPRLPEKLDYEPLLTEDGFHVIAMTSERIYACKIVDLDGKELVTDIEYVWQVLMMYENAFSNDINFRPIGSFASIDNFAVIYKKRTDTNDIRLFGKYVESGISPLTVRSFALSLPNTTTDKMTMKFHHIGNVGSATSLIVISILSKGYLFDVQSGDTSVSDGYYLNLYRLRYISQSNTYVPDSKSTSIYLTRNLNASVVYTDNLRNAAIGSTITKRDTVSIIFDVKMAFSYWVSEDYPLEFKQVSNYAGREYVYWFQCILTGEGIIDNNSINTIPIVTNTNHNVSTEFRMSIDTQIIVTDKCIYNGSHRIDLPEIDNKTVAGQGSPISSGDIIEVVLEDGRIARGHICSLNLHINESNSTAVSLNYVNNEVSSYDYVLFAELNNTPYSTRNMLAKKYALFNIYKLTLTDSGKNYSEYKDVDAAQNILHYGDLILLKSNQQIKTISFNGSTYTFDAIKMPNSVTVYSGSYTCETLSGPSAWPKDLIAKGLAPFAIANGTGRNAFPVKEGEIQYWKSGQRLPFTNFWETNHTNWCEKDNNETPSVMCAEYIGIVQKKNSTPIYADNDGVIIGIGNTIYSSIMTEDVILYLDETVGNVDAIQYAYNRYIPEHVSIMNNIFLSQGNILSISSPRYDKNKENTSFQSKPLLYLPLENNKTFTYNITNLHLLQDTQMGIFFNDEAWLCENVDINGVNAYMYTKSRLSIGCREGDDILTSVDGQYVIIPMQRGLAAVQPQQFMATTEQIITLLSDSIETSYNDFYNSSVRYVFNGYKGETLKDPHIKMLHYRYWELFYKEYDRTIFLFDVRTNTWWKWTLPYAIRKIYGKNKLYVLCMMPYMHVSHLNLKQTSTISEYTILLCFDEDKKDYKDYIHTTAYNNEIYLNGDYKIIPYGDSFNRIEMIKVNPFINWSITSQKLHFNAINNYKKIVQFNTICSGEYTQKAKLTMKAFRDLTHPEQSVVIENKVNDLRIFITRMNLMRTQFFQYKLEADITQENAVPLKMNGLNIKYRIEENIR